MIKYMFFLLSASVIAHTASAQYAPVDTLSGVEIAWRWAAETWYKPKSDRVLLIRTINRNEYAVDYSFEVIISRDGKVLETSPSASHCIRQKWTAKGRLNGIVLKPLSLTREDIQKGNYELSIELSNVEQTESCNSSN